jgi:hypothetical protein
VQALFEAIVQPAVTNFATAFTTYSATDDPDTEQALSGTSGWFAPTNTDAAGRYLVGLTAINSGDVGYRPWVRDAIPGNTDWVNLGTTLPKTSRQSYTGVWLFRPYGASLGLQSLTLKSDEVAGCKSVSGKVTLSAAAPAGGVVVTLSDTLAASVSPTVLNIGSVLVGSTSPPLMTTLTNKGAIAVAIDSIAVTGTYASWFPMTENCPNSLAAGASCTISVRFAPIAAATRSAKVTITTSATATPLSVTVKGTGAM